MYNRGLSSIGVGESFFYRNSPRIKPEPSSIGVDEGSLVAPELLLPALVVVLSPLLIAAVLLALLLVLAEQKLLELALIQLSELAKFSILLPKKTDLLPQALLTLLLALLQELLSRSNEVLEDLVNELISRLLAQVEQDDGDNNRDVGSERVDGVRDSVEHVNRLLS